jgi:hypothetical protein
MIPRFRGRVATKRGPGRVVGLKAFGIVGKKANNIHDQKHHCSGQR